MAKSETRKTKKTAKTKKRTTSSKQTKATETVGCLLELHKLQGVLLTQLRKDI